MAHTIIDIFDALVELLEELPPGTGYDSLTPWQHATGRFELAEQPANARQRLFTLELRELAAPEAGWQGDTCLQTARFRLLSASRTDPDRLAEERLLAHDAEKLHTALSKQSSIAQVGAAFITVSRLEVDRSILPSRQPVIAVHFEVQYQLAFA